MEQGSERDQYFRILEARRQWYSQRYYLESAARWAMYLLLFGAALLLGRLTLSTAVTLFAIAWLLELLGRYRLGWFSARVSEINSELAQNLPEPLRGRYIRQISQRVPASPFGKLLLRTASLFWPVAVTAIGLIRLFLDGPGA